LSILAAEGALLGAFGVAFGLILGTLLIAYFGRAGLPLPVGDALAYFLPFDQILFLKPAWPEHARSAAVMAVVAVLAALGPAVRASRLKVVEALRHV
jgi:putative ABC transport system permease protein